MSWVSHECSKGRRLERFSVSVPVDVRNSVGFAGVTA